MPIRGAGPGAEVQLYQGSEHVITKRSRPQPHVEKMTSGRVKVNVFDSGTQAKGPQMFDAVQKEWSTSPRGPMRSRAQEHAVPHGGTFPFMYRDAAATSIPGRMRLWKSGQ